MIYNEFIKDTAPDISYSCKYTHYTIDGHIDFQAVRSSVNEEWQDNTENAKRQEQIAELEKELARLQKIQERRLQKKLLNMEVRDNDSL